MDKTIKET